MKPKILIFIDWYKPGFKAGGPIRSISNLVSQLHNSYNFYIITRNTDYLETVPYTNIKTDEWNEVDNAKVFYLSKNNTNKSVINQLIKEINPNLIYCNSLYSPKYTLTPIRIANKLNIKTIVAVRGMLSKGSLSVKSHKKKVFLTIVKTVGLFSKTIFHATSQEEKEDINQTFGTKLKVVVANNLPEQKENTFKVKAKEEGLLKMVFIGRIAPEKNLLYAIETLKMCKQSIELDIFGPVYNQQYFEDCKKIINLLPQNIVVNYKGALKHHLLDETLKHYQVIYLPSTGENFGHSIIEGMASGCIPIISNKTPWQKLEEKKIGFDIDLNDPESYANKIDYLATLKQAKLNEMAENAYHYAKSIINDNQLKEDYHKLFN